MSKEELLEFPGVVSELLPNATFRVKLENGHEIIAHTAGKMRNTLSLIGNNRYHSAESQSTGRAP